MSDFERMDALARHLAHLLSLIQDLASYLRRETKRRNNESDYE